MGAAKTRGNARQNRRGSPEAIEKRRAARLFNDVLGGRRAALRLDGRSEKRRQRLLADLESGTSRGRPLKPLDVLQRVHELLGFGETVASLRRLVKSKKIVLVAIDAQRELADVVGRLHRAYGFAPEAYRFVGIDEALLREAGVIDAPARGGRPKARKRV